MGLEVSNPGLSPTTGGTVSGPLTESGGLTLAGHVATAGAAPAVAVTANAGVGATAVANGTDEAGNVALTVGAGSAAGKMATLTFATPYASPPRSVLMNFTSTLGGLAITIAAANVTANGFDIYVTFALAASTYPLSYLVVA